MKGRNLQDALVYADSQTYSGPDDDPNFDENDELVFMARHLGTHQAAQSQFPFKVRSDNFHCIFDHLKACNYSDLYKKRAWWINMHGGNNKCAWLNKRA